MTKPLILLFGLIGTSGFIVWSSVRFDVFLNSGMDINWFVGLLMWLQFVKNWLHLVSRVSVLKDAEWSLSFELSDTSLSILSMKVSLCSQSMVSWILCWGHLHAHIVHGVLREKKGIISGDSLVLKSIMNLPQVLYCSIREPIAPEFWAMIFLASLDTLFERVVQTFNLLSKCRM